MDTGVGTHSDLLLTARTAHVRRDWHASYAAFTRAGEDTPLGTDDLEAMAAAAWRLGHGKESLRVAERVYTQLVRTDPASAAMKAVDLALAWLTRGDLNIGQGWMNRARRLLDGAPEAPTHGYLAYLDAVVAVMNRDTAVLPERVTALRELSGRLDSPALTALCHVAQGLEAMLDARMAEAYGLIDEAMLPVLADQLPLEWAGDIYCIVLHHCHRLADLPRMRAWTQSMQRWCNDFAGSANYGGVCDVHRLQVQGGRRRLPLARGATGRRQQRVGGGKHLGGRGGLLPTRRGAQASRRRRRRVRGVRAGTVAGRGPPARRGTAALRRR